jgi:hypothetical protein
MYCECGCGNITPIAKETSRRKGWIKGQHKRCCYGHSPLKHLAHYQGRDIWISINQNKHLCQCGCGEYILIKKHHKSMGIPKFIWGHHMNTDKIKMENSIRSSKRVGNLSPRWKEDRNTVRGRIRCQVDFTKRQKRDIYVRDNGICQNCKIICLLDVGVNHPYKVNIDHIILVKDGGTNDISNGQVLCLSCHKLKHSAKAKTANSEKPNLNLLSMATPNQAPNLGACVETNVQSSKEMI